MMSDINVKWEEMTRFDYQDPNKPQNGYYVNGVFRKNYLKHSIHIEITEEGTHVRWSAYFDGTKIAHGLEMVASEMLVDPYLVNVIKDKVVAVIKRSMKYAA